MATTRRRSLQVEVRGNRARHLGQDSRFQGVQRLLQHAAQRAHGHPHRGSAPRSDEPAFRFQFTCQSISQSWGLLYGSSGISAPSWHGERGRHAAALVRGSCRTSGRGALRRAGLRQPFSSAHHRQSRATAADLFPRAQRQSWRRQHGRAPPARCWRGVSQTVRDCAKYTAFSRLHLSRFRALCPDLRQGRRLRPYRDTDQATSRHAARRAAARRRRHVARLGFGLVVEGARHGGGRRSCSASTS